MLVAAHCLWLHLHTCLDGQSLVHGWNATISVEGSKGHFLRFYIKIIRPRYRDLFFCFFFLFQKALQVITLMESLCRAVLTPLKQSVLLEAHGNAGLMLVSIAYLDSNASSSQNLNKNIFFSTAKVQWALQLRRSNYSDDPQWWKEPVAYQEDLFGSVVFALFSLIPHTQIKFLCSLFIYLHAPNINLNLVFTTMCQEACQRWWHAGIAKFFRLVVMTFSSWE